MTKPGPIPTPLLRQLNLFRVQVIPGAAFLLCALLTLWLWQRQMVILTPSPAPTVPTSVEKANLATMKP